MAYWDVNGTEPSLMLLLTPVLLLRRQCLLWKKKPVDDQYKHGGPFILITFVTVNQL